MFCLEWDEVGDKQARGMSAGFDVEQEQQAREHLKYFLCDHHSNAEEDQHNDAEKKSSLFDAWLDFLSGGSSPNPKVRGSF